MTFGSSFSRRRPFQGNKRELIARRFRTQKSVCAQGILSTTPKRQLLENCEAAAFASPSHPPHAPSQPFHLARLAVAAEAVFIVWGWTWSQYPFMIPPSRTIESLAAPRATLMWVMGTLIISTLILLPSFVYLFRIFKSSDSAQVEH